MVKEWIKIKDHGVNNVAIRIGLGWCVGMLLRKNGNSETYDI